MRKINWKRENDMVHEELENMKASLKNINDMADIKSNPVVGSLFIAPIKAIPGFGDLIDSSVDKLLDTFQKKKEQELVDIILKNDTVITTEMVSDVEFIINYARVVETVRRLATNDKVRFFGNLIRNGYLSGDHIENSVFEEYLDILNTMSYREIRYLAVFKKHCEETKINRWASFSKKYSEIFGITSGELYYSFVRMKQTGFLDEEFETDSGDVDEDDLSFSSLDVDGKGFHITERFVKFYNMVLKQWDSEII
ncbi:MAG: hypothetical protein Q4B70_15015 [Lachnospiraceae bacterium]|nr:hypothetical protein [Lachnospiraceae bacterium]